MEDNSPVARIKQRIEAEIAKLPENTAAARKAVYDKFRAVVTGNPKFSHLIGALESTITQIEQVEMVHSPEQTPTTKRVTEPATKGKTISLIAAAVAVIAVAGAGWWYFGAARPVADFDQGVSGYSTAPERQDIAPDDPKYVSRKDGDDYVLEVSGEAPIYASKGIPVDTQKTYRLTAKIRVLTDDPQQQGSVMYVGVATFDSKGELQTTAPGSHRYAALSGKLIKSSDGWVEVEGLLTGEGNETPNQFRPDTKNVKPVALLNYKSPGAVSQISYLRFEEVKN